MSNFKFNVGAVTPQTPVTVNDGETIAPRPVRSASERIEAARAICIAADRESNSPSQDWGQHLPSRFFQDFGHGSCWLARHIYFLATLIETRYAHGKLIPLGHAQSFDPSSGIFEALDGMSLFTLTAFYKLRIKELGISEVLLEEWAARIHTIVEDAEFYALPFEGRMATFKESK
jgi:hypothetical protein